MAITKVGLKNARKGSGNTVTGVKTYLVGSDTKVSDDIDQILDASELGGDAIPGFNELWSLDTTVNLRVDNKVADAWDLEEGTQEGFWWVVTVNYAVPEFSDNQSEEDPRDRAWLWSKSSEKEETTLATSLFDTSAYVYPAAGADQMVNLASGDAITNTAFEPPENGVDSPFSRRVIQLSKYVDDFSDLGASSWDDLDSYIDTVNSTTISLLGISYDKWELYIDDIAYEPVSINGYDVIKVVFRIIADTYKTHVFTFPSAGYNEIKDDKLVPATLPNGEDPTQPRLLDDTGAAIPTPSSAPYISTPYLVSVGRHPEKDFSPLTLPSTIP